MTVRPRWVIGLVTLALGCSDGNGAPAPSAAGTGAGGTPPSAGSSAVAGAGSPSVEAGTGGAGGSSAGSAGSAGSGGSGGSAGAEDVGEIMIASDQMVPTGIAIDDTSVYWANRDAGSIVKCPLQGCGAEEPTLLASNIGEPLGLAVDDESFYWMTPDANAWSCPLSGCTGVPEQVLELGSVNRATDVHVVAADLYFAAWPLLGYCSKGGCIEDSPTLFGNMPAISLDSNADTLFVARVDGVISCSLAGCLEPVTLAAEVSAMGLSIDTSHVYLAQSDYLMMGGDPIVPAISRCPLAGCGDDAPEVVASGEISPFGVVVSDRRIFYTNYSHGTVVSTPKP